MTNCVIYFANDITKDVNYFLYTIYFDSTFDRDAATMLLKDFGIEYTVTTPAKKLFKKVRESISIEAANRECATYLLTKNAVKFDVEK